MNNECLRFLFAQYAANRISKTELTALQAHLGQASDDDALRGLVSDELRHVAEAGDAAASAEEEKWLHGLESQVWEKITRMPALRKTRRLNPWRRAIAVAASVLVAATVGTYMFLGNQGVNQKAVTTNAGDIAPGTNRATLTLADGRTVDLSEEQSGIIVGDEITYLDGSEVLAVNNASHRMSLTTPNGGTYQLLLPDGTKVWLNAASTLKYPSRFDGTERRVEIYGEGYFQVTKDRGKPFKVVSKGQTVEVLGTEFNISAYTNEPSVKTTLVEGSVQIALPESGIVNRLSPGQQAMLNGTDMNIHVVDVRDQVAWKDGLIVLNEADLPAIARQIERWYDVDVVLPPLPPTEQVYGELRRDVHLSELLHSLHLHYGLNFKIEGRKVIVSN